MAGVLVNHMQAYHHSLYDGLTRIKLVEPLVEQGDGKLVKRSSVCTESHDT
jgi:hypothetical protein